MSVDVYCQSGLVDFAYDTSCRADLRVQPGGTSLTDGVVRSATSGKGGPIEGPRSAAIPDC